MNTSKQINVMIGLLFVLFVITGGYLFNESNRQEEETEEITERNAERGARIFVRNCRTCHGLEGEGGIGPKLNNPAFLILGESNVFDVDETPEGEAANIEIYLRETISCGRAGTFMPKWAIDFGGSLSNTQVDQLVTLITNDSTGKTDYWDLVIAEGEEADEEQFGPVLETRFVRTGMLRDRLGREPTAEEVEAFDDELTHAQVREFGREPTTEEIRAESEARTPVTDATALSITENTCGQFTAEKKAEVRSRPDPGAPAAATATATPDTTATAPPPPSGDGENIAVDLAEFTVTAPSGSAPSGTITFNVSNAGVVVHNFRVIRSGAAPDALPIAGGVVDEGAVDVVARIEEFPAGVTESVKVDLAAGSYLLICNVPGHYQLGMTTAFTVQ